MTARLLVDASALAALLFGEPEHDAVRQELGEAELYAPKLLPLELANVCVKKVRRHPEIAAQLLKALNSAELLDIRFYDVPATDVALLAVDKGLSAYDASYLWLSRHLGIRLVTLDRHLARAAAH